MPSPTRPCTRTYGYVAYVGNLINVVNVVNVVYVAYVRNGPIVVRPYGEADGVVSTVP